MLKKISAGILVVVGIVLGAVAAGAVFEPYILSYNVTYRGSHEGIRAGWTLDNRAGSARNTIYSDYSTLVDCDTNRTSALYRDLNFTDEGIVTLETAFRVNIGFDGLTVKFTDSEGNVTYALETDNGAVYLHTAGGRRLLLSPSDKKASIHLLVTLNFETGKATTVLNGVDYGESSLLSDNISRFGFYTSREDILTVVPQGAKITANYTLFDDFTYYNRSSNCVPYGWKSADAADAYVKDAVAYVKNGVPLTRSFAPIGKKAVFEGALYLEPNAVGKVELFSGTDAAVSLSMDKDALKVNGVTIREDILEGFWHRIRVEMDFNSHTLRVKLNGRYNDRGVALPDTVYIDEAIVSVDNAIFCASGNGMRFDDIRLFSQVNHGDYVPAPQIPRDSKNNIVGINVCSLWGYESGHGWSCITPYDECRPVLGYYDEGNPEVADWEIKFLAEHGVDFQAFCWYADTSTGPMKLSRSHSLHLHEGFMNAKYSNLTKYCIIWEAANAAKPQSIEAFRKYFVPYWIENYFKDERYMTIGNSPVFICFGVDRFIGSIGGIAKAREALDYLRSEVKALGFDDLIIIASNTKDSQTILDAGMDGVHAYNWGTKGYDLHHNISSIQSSADKGFTYTIPTLSVGFNSLPWHGVRYPIMNVRDYKDGLMWIRDEYFAAYPKDKSKKKDWQKNFLMLSTWNEYGEGTYIMPCEELHGFGYLDAIREVFTDNDAPHSDDIPNERQLARITKNYPQNTRLLRRLANTEYNSKTTLFSRGDAVSFSDKMTFAAYDAEDVSFKGGTLSGKTPSVTDYKQAYIENHRDLDISLKDVTAMRFVMSVSKDTDVKIYFTTSDRPHYAKEQSFTIKAAAGGKKAYTVYSDALSGRLKKLRIYPSNEAGVSFALKSFSVLERAGLYVDELQIQSEVYAESRNGKLYYPFDPGIAEHFVMNLHYEWNHASKTLSVYGDDNRYIIYTVGSDIAKTHNGDITLPAPLFTLDGLPMLDMESFCKTLGFGYETVGKSYYIRTPKYEDNSYIFNRPENEWDFTHGIDYGWTGNANISIQNKRLHVESYEKDTRLTVGNLNLPADNYSAVEIKVRYTSPSVAPIQVFFITDKDKNWNEAKGMTLSKPTRTSDDGSMLYSIPIATKTTWKDAITSLRVDPLHTPGGIVDIEYIKLIPTEKSPLASSDNHTQTVTLDAENGIAPFSSGNAAVTITEDPLHPGNRVYKVTPTKSESKYININYNLKWEPGATYEISFRVLADSVEGDSKLSTHATIHPDLRFDDPKAQYEKRINPDDHLPLSVADVKTNDTKWRKATFTYTIPKYTYLRSTDTFRIFANPVNGKSLLYYIDDIVIKRKATASL